MILLDTNIVTLYAYGNPSILNRIQSLDDSEELGITVISRYEILRGRVENLLKTANKQELTIAVDRFCKSETLISAFIVVGFDVNSISHFGSLRSDRNLKRMGRADIAYFRSM